MAGKKEEGDEMVRKVKEGEEVVEEKVEGREGEVEGEEEEEYLVGEERERVVREVLFKRAKRVALCGCCGVPHEYCEFGSTVQFKKCREYLKTRDHELYVKLGYEALEQKLKREEEEAKKKKASNEAKLPTQDKFNPWVHIYALHRVSAKCLNTKDVLNVRGKIKLHGTNTGVNVYFNEHTRSVEAYAQSRNRFVYVDKESHGFSTFVQNNKPFFASVFDALNSHLSSAGKGVSAWLKNLTIFGEWCGKGINKGASVCTLDKRIFSVFSVQLNSSLAVYAPEGIEAVLSGATAKRPDNLFVLPYGTPEVVLNFGDVPSLTASIDYMNQVVEDVDKEDPWIKETFGVVGAGEGLVWYPTTVQSEQLVSSGVQDSQEEAEMKKIVKEKFSASDIQYLNLLFKTKGPTHSVVQQKRCVQLTPEIASTAEHFAEMFVTKARLEQALQESKHEPGYGRSRRGKKGKPQAKKPEDAADESVKKQKQLPHFLKWIVSDIKREGEDELDASGLKWDDVATAIEISARRWYQAEVLNLGGLRE